MSCEYYLSIIHTSIMTSINLLNTHFNPFKVATKWKWKKIEPFCRFLHAIFSERNFNKKIILTLLVSLFTKVWVKYHLLMGKGPINFNGCQFRRASLYPRLISSRAKLIHVRIWNYITLSAFRERYVYSWSFIIEKRVPLCV